MTDSKGGTKDVIKGKKTDATKGKTREAKGGIKDVIKGKRTDAISVKMKDLKSVMRGEMKSRIKDKTREQNKDRMKDNLGLKSIFLQSKSQEIQRKLSNSLQKGNKDHQH